MKKKKAEIYDLRPALRKKRLNDLEVRFDVEGLTKIDLRGVQRIQDAVNESIFDKVVFRVPSH